MNNHIKSLLAGAVLSALPSLAIAAEAAIAAAAPTEYTLLDSVKTGKPMTSFRLRYEDVSQDGNAPSPAPSNPLKDGHGLTLRSLIGWQTAPFHNFSFAAQLIDVHKFQSFYNDSTNGTGTNGGSNEPDRAAYAKIVDPDYSGVNQLYLDWTGIKNTRLRVGRQQVNLDNVRFIGDIGFRQVMQVFDGESLLNKSIPDTQIFLARFNRVRQINTVLRNDGSLNIANVKYNFSPTESLVGYAYLSSFEDLGFGNAWFGAGNATKNQSNEIFGARLDGIHKIDDDWKALYTAEYAKQDGYKGGDDRIDAHYYKIGGGAGYGNFSLRADQELLSSNHGTYAFQTPFGTNHLFQGWVDKFLATPREGIRDSFVTATYKYGDFTFFTDYHVFDSDEDFHTVGGGAGTPGSRYGKEWNAAVSYAYDIHTLAKIEYGKFTEGDHYALAASTPNTTAGNGGRIRDTDKLWLTVMYTF